MSNEKAMCRFEFLEVLVRLANDKYRAPGKDKTFAAALTRLMTKDVIPNYQPEP